MKILGEFFLIFCLVSMAQLVNFVLKFLLSMHLFLGHMLGFEVIAMGHHFVSKVLNSSWDLELGNTETLCRLVFLMMGLLLWVMSGARLRELHHHLVFKKFFVLLLTFLNLNIGEILRSFLGIILVRSLDLLNI
jgi:hypothetical protein